MPTEQPKQPTRSEAFAKLRDLLVERCPESAVEIFDAVTALESATLREVHAGVLAALTPGGAS